VIVLQMPLAVPFAPSIERTIITWMTAGARVTGVLVVAPFLGSAAVPPRIKLGFAFLLTLFLVPFVPAPPTSLTTPALIVLLLGEFAIGFLLGFTLQLIFEAGQIAGQVCGIQMGYSLASLVNPDNSQADSGRALDFLRAGRAPALPAAQRPALAVARIGPQLQLSASRAIFR
jgi:flagellar biosynthesis protein FliR